MNTIQQYRSAWKDMNAPIRFLDDPSCRSAIEKAEPSLVHFFDLEREGKFRADVCRVAFLYNEGGYYFDVDLAVIQPLVLNSTIKFASVLSGEPNWDQFFQAFLAATPKHAVLGEALRIMLLYYEGKHTLRGRNVGTSTLYDAYDNIDATVRGPSKLLYETKNAEGSEWYYPNIPKNVGVGCCCQQICHSAEDRVAYFYSRVPGSGNYCRLPGFGSDKSSGINLARGAQSPMVALQKGKLLSGTIKV